MKKIVSNDLLNAGGEMTMKMYLSGSGNADLSE